MELSQPKRSNILILRGVFPRDFTTTDVFHTNPTPRTEVATLTYSDIPKQFTSTTTWPKSTNLKCWECDQTFTTQPAFVPMNIERVGDNDVCDPHGNFNTWNCAVRYTMREFPKELQWDLLQGICLYEAKFTGHRRQKIMPAYPKTLMKAYCGSGGLTPKQYSDKNEQMNSDYAMSQFKVEHFGAAPHRGSL